MSQKFSGESKCPKLKWEFQINEDGTVNFTVRAKRLRLREERGQFRYSILQWQNKLPFSIKMDGHGVVTHAELRLWSEISPEDIPSVRWGMLHKLANGKPRKTDPRIEPLEGRKPARNEAHLEADKSRKANGAEAGRIS